MKLIINVSNNLGGGGLQVALSFLNECVGYPENEYHVFLGANTANQIDQGRFPGNFVFYDIPTIPLRKLGQYLSWLEKSIRPDCVFTVFGPSYWRPVSKHVEGFARGYWIYPESSFFKTMAPLQKIFYRIRKNIKLFFFKREADAYVVETEDANKRLRRLFGTDQVYTVSNTCGAQYFHAQSFAAKLPEKQPGEFRLVTLSAYYPHKNLEIIPKTLDALKGKPGSEKIRFALTLQPEDYRRIIPVRYRDRVYNAGPVPAAEGPSLYKECDAMFLPTMLECFSASYPEAMAMGLPILTSDLDFAHSICGDAALYFDTLAPRDAGGKIMDLLNDRALYGDLVGKGKQRLSTFNTAKERAERYLELCRSLSGENRKK